MIFQKNNNSQYTYNKYIYYSSARSSKYKKHRRDNNLNFLLLILLLVIVIIFSSCTPAVRFSTNITTRTTSTKDQDNIYEDKNNNQAINSNTGLTFRGIASYYGDKFEGRTTASGEIFRQNVLTAAHKSLPFGTRVKVTRVDNGKSIIVKINDRGPFVAGRIIDLSYSAALAIDIIQMGVAEVVVEVVE